MKLAEFVESSEARNMKLEHLAIARLPVSLRRNYPQRNDVNIDTASLTKAEKFCYIIDHGELDGISQPFPGIGIYYLGFFIAVEGVNKYAARIEVKYFGPSHQKITTYVVKMTTH